MAHNSAKERLDSADLDARLRRSTITGSGVARRGTVRKDSKESKDSKETSSSAHFLHEPPDFEYYREELRGKHAEAYPETFLINTPDKGLRRQDSEFDSPDTMSLESRHRLSGSPAMSSPRERSTSRMEPARDDGGGQGHAANAARSDSLPGAEFASTSAAAAAAGPHRGHTAPSPRDSSQIRPPVRSATEAPTPRAQQQQSGTEYSFAESTDGAHAQDPTEGSLNARGWILETDASALGGQGDIYSKAREFGFLDQRPEPSGTQINIDADDPSYIIIRAQLPGVSIDNITIALRRNHRLHIVADSYGPTGGHLEKLIVLRVAVSGSSPRAEFDGNLLNVYLKRKRPIVGAHWPYDAEDRRPKSSASHMGNNASRSPGAAAKPASLASEADHAGLQSPYANPAASKSLNDIALEGPDSNTPLEGLSELFSSKLMSGGSVIDPNTNVVSKFDEPLTVKAPHENELYDIIRANKSPAFANSLPPDDSSPHNSAMSSLSALSSNSSSQSSDANAHSDPAAPKTPAADLNNDHANAAAEAEHPRTIILIESGAEGESPVVTAAAGAPPRDRDTRRNIIGPEGARRAAQQARREAEERARLAAMKLPKPLPNAPFRDLRFGKTDHVTGIVPDSPIIKQLKQRHGDK